MESKFEVPQESRDTLERVLQEKITQIQKELKDLQSLYKEIRRKPSPATSLSEPHKQFNCKSSTSPSSQDHKRKSPHEVIKEICRIMDSKGGVDVRCAEIAHERGVTTPCVYNQMRKYVNKPECPWKQGSAKMKFSLKRG